jgi:ADP-ribose diphosphatase
MTQTKIVDSAGGDFQVMGLDGRATYVDGRLQAKCVPLTDTGMVIFIVEPSPAYGQDMIYLPGGGINPGESHEDAANRELQEEIGYKALRLNYLGELRPWSKFLRSSVHHYLARDLTPSKLAGDELYKITTQLVPLNDFERLITTGRLYDSTVIAALYMARHFLRREQEMAEDEAEE